LNTPHIPVLLDEVLSFVDFSESGIMIDMTAGFGGHSIEVLQKSKLDLICNDKDIKALDFSKNRLNDFKNRVSFINKTFSEVIKELEVDNLKIILADIGVSSYQLDEEYRGFSFNSDSLDMRMDDRNELNAKYVVNNYSITELEDIFKNYGEVRDYKRMAFAICEYRKDKQIESAKELSQIVARNTRKFSKLNPATLIFQAIRIEVNDELGELKKLLDNIESVSPKGTRVILISFHSLEDRIIKNKFKQWIKKCICDESVMRCECGNNHQKGKILTKKPLVANDKEIKNNPRSRSAKLRAFEFNA